MPIFTCPNCLRRLRVTESQLGRKLRCSRCAGRFIADANLPPDVYVEDYSGEPPPVQSTNTGGSGDAPSPPPVQAANPVGSGGAPSPPPTVSRDDTLVGQIAAIKAIHFGGLNDRVKRIFMVIGGIWVLAGILWLANQVMHAQVEQLRIENEYHEKLREERHRDNVEQLLENQYRERLRRR